jgi:hypothetical protein
MKRPRLARIAQATVLAGTLSLTLVGPAQAVQAKLSDLTSIPNFTLTDGKVTLSDFVFTFDSSNPGNFDPDDPVNFFFNPFTPNYYTFEYTPSGFRYGAGTLTYTATINDPDYRFDLATVGLLGSGPSSTRHISLTETGALMDPATLTGTGGTVHPPSYFTTGTSVAHFSTSWDIPIGETITALNNQMAIEVPAPLPILGALAAFGWSRKLRRRTRAAGPAGLGADKGLALAA